MTTRISRPLPQRQVPGDRAGLGEWLLSTDHKRIGLMTMTVSLVLLYFNGSLALTIRAQLAQPGQSILSPQMYNQFFTEHGSGMIFTVITPISVALGVYLIPLMVGAPRIAAPRITLLGFWFIAFGALCLIWGFLTPGGADAGWWSYLPLSNSIYSGGPGEDLWIAGVFLSTAGTLMQGWTVLWTILRLRAPGMTLMHIPVFAWTQIANCLLVIAAFPAQLAAMAILALARVDPLAFQSNFWVFGYQQLFWFYGHPVVYVMFFPFVGCAAECLQVFSGVRWFGYSATAIALLVFSTGSMAVWGHHLFASGQQVNDYFSLTSIGLLVPAGIEYFGFLATMVQGRHRYTTAMLFAITFFLQFLIGGLTGILVASPAIDYHLNNSYFILGHFHYTIFAGSFFGFMAGFYFWFPKATGFYLSEAIGKVHFVLMVIGTNVTFIPFFILGYIGMPRQIASYPAGAGFTTLNLISSIGAGFLGLAFLVFAYNVYISLRRKAPAAANAWGGFTLEWATSSPPPRFNFNLQYPIPKITSFAPLLDLWERQRDRAKAASLGDGRTLGEGGEGEAAALGEQLPPPDGPAAHPPGRGGEHPPGVGQEQSPRTPPRQE